MFEIKRTCFDTRHTWRYLEVIASGHKERLRGVKVDGADGAHVFVERV